MRGKIFYSLRESDLSPVGCDVHYPKRWHVFLLSLRRSSSVRAHCLRESDTKLEAVNMALHYVGLAATLLTNPVVHVLVFLFRVNGLKI